MADYRNFPLLEQNRQIHCNTRSCLFCFCHAGGSARVFSPWEALVERGIEVAAAELPGHLLRFNEPCIRSWDGLSRTLVDEMVDIADGRPSFLFGHSLGSLVAFNCALEFERRSANLRGMIVAAHPSPDRQVRGYKSSMGIEKLSAELLRLGGTPNDLIYDERFQKTFLPVIFNDYVLHDAYVHEGKTINASIETHWGDKDYVVEGEDISAWANMTTGNFSSVILPGDHFFPYIKQNNYQTILADFCTFNQER